jgi:hypothetical protein
VSKEIPAAKNGNTNQEITIPPLEVGVTDVIAVPLVSVNEFGV